MICLSEPGLTAALNIFYILSTTDLSSERKILDQRLKSGPDTQEILDTGTDQAAVSHSVTWTLTFYYIISMYSQFSS
jgi:phosphoenolpyruvate carboxylase